MGKYINYTTKGHIGATFKEKSEAIQADGATQIEEPEQWAEDLVIIINNGKFAVVGYAYDERELNRIKANYHGRGYQWFNYPNANLLAI